jgi:hypothetical protein
MSNSIDNVISWDYVKLRIASEERYRTIQAYYRASNSPQGIDAELIARCQRSDVMLTEALAPFCEPVSPNQGQNEQ